MTTNCAPSSATSVREDRSRATSRNPAAISSSGAAPSVEAAGPGSPTVSRPPTAATAAITAKTVATPLTPRITPAAAGARKMPALSIQDETTLAAVSSSGLRAKPGTSAAWAGRVSVTVVAAAAASA